MLIERYTARSRSGVRWWRIRRLKVGLWRRNTRRQAVQSFDPWPRLWVGPWRFALLLPFQTRRPRFLWTPRRQRIRVRHG